MLGLLPSTKIYLACGATDMRRGFDGLMAIVRNTWEADIFSGHLFVFLGHKRTLVKILHWNRGWLVLYSKRLEKGRFIRPKISTDGQSVLIDAVELTLLLDGIAMSGVKRPALWEPAK